MEPAQLLTRYFTHLEAGDFEGAAECFGEAARYSHPPYADDPPGNGRHEAYGRDEILALFQHRGTRSTRHELTGLASAGDHWFVSGIVKESQGQVVASFVSQARVDPATGLFAEYVAYSSRPAVWEAESTAPQASAQRPLDI